MTQWGLFIAAFWAWYVVDCIKASRRARFLFGSFWGGRRASTQHGHLTLAPILPLGWHGQGDDLPYSFSPDGLCNQSVGTAGRPADEPDVIRAWRWEEIKKVHTRRGRIFINGQDFCAASSFGDSAYLQGMAADLAALPIAERERRLQSLLASWFRPLRLQRVLKSARGRTGLLRDLMCVNLLLALGVSAYLLGNGPALVGHFWADRLVQMLPWLGGYFAALHLAIIVVAWRVHRRFLPKAGEQRTGLLLNAALLPAYALRLRAQIIAAYFPVQHPLAWAAAVGTRTQQQSIARHVVSDLRWPLPARRSERGELVARVTAWMRERLGGEVARVLPAMELTADALLAPPLRDSEASCAYCPRCGDQFTTAQGSCPRGIPSQTLKS